jgi:hypothetical protein
MKDLKLLEFKIYLTERANSEGLLQRQLDELTLEYLAEISKLSYETLLLDRPPEPPKTIIAKNKKSRKEQVIEILKNYNSIENGIKHWDSTNSQD